MNAWERSRDLVLAVMPFVPSGQNMLMGHEFLFQGDQSVFQYRSEAMSEPVVVTAYFRSFEMPSKENFLGLGVSGSRSVFLLEQRIHDEPRLFVAEYPSFTYAWDAKQDSEQGTLTFLRIDLTLEDFVNYEGADLCESMRQGHDEAFSLLPPSLSETDTILGRTIPRSINFVRRAEHILRGSKLEKFVRVCAALNS